MVFEYVEHDLHGLIDQGVCLNAASVKCIMHQILEGLCYVHSQHVLHRDLKGANILLSHEGVVKLADFGLARKCEARLDRMLTNRVVTPWYRCPELLLGSHRYTAAIDMWSLGCCFYELLTLRAPFHAMQEHKLLEQIYEKCGSPTAETWPEQVSLKNYQQLAPKKTYVRRLHEDFQGHPQYSPSD
jgi:cyclin-dependent kinase 12/13